MSTLFKSSGGFDANNQPISNIADAVDLQDALNLRGFTERNTLPVYSTSRTYPVDFVVEYNGQLWKCISPVTVTGGAFDRSKWKALAGKESWLRITGAYTANPMDSLLVDTTSGAITITLPLNPASGDYVVIQDSGNADVNNITINRNGQTINGSAANQTIIDAGSTVTLLYLNNTWVLNRTRIPRVKIANGALTASSNTRYAFDSASSYTVTLPASPKAGDWVEIFDRSGTLGANVITVSGNSKQIDGFASIGLNQRGGAWLFTYDGVSWKSQAYYGNSLQADKNLQELTDKAAARNNLLLGSLAVLNSGTGAGDVRTNAQNEALFQPKDATLTAIAALVTAADKLIYSTGADQFAQSDLTARARTFLAQASQSAQRGDLGLGSAAVLNAGNSIGDLMQVGAFGLGSFTLSTNTPNTITVTGFYTVPMAATGAPNPALNSVMLHYEIASAVEAGAVQLAIDTNTVLYVRVRSGASTWTAWSSISPASSLGTAAYQDIGLNAGDVMGVGSFGLGTNTIPNIGNADIVHPSGLYRFVNGTDTGTVPVVGWSGVILVESYNSGVSRQFAMTVSASVNVTTMYTRLISPIGVGAWAEVLTTDNSGKVPTLPSLNNGVTYGVKDNAWVALPTKASTADVIAGTDDVKYVTSKSLSEGIETERLKVAAFPVKQKGDLPYADMLVLMSDGTVRAWGGQYPASIGVNEATSITYPISTPCYNVPIPEGVKVKEIHKASCFTYILLTNGWVYSAGVNDYGQLGHGDTTARYVFTRVEYFITNGILIDKITLTGTWRYSSTMGTAHFISTTKNVYACGYNGIGQLGDGTLVNKTTPVQITALSDIKEIISSGGSRAHMAAITETNSLYVWGPNDQGSLGDGTTVAKSTPFLASFPGAVPNTVAKVSLASCWDSTPTNYYGSSIVLMQNGDVYVAGYNGYGNLGDGTTTTRTTWTKNTLMPAGIVDIGLRACPYGTGYAITSGKELYMWGRDDTNYAIGLTGAVSITTPTLMKGTNTDPSSPTTPFQGKVKQVVWVPNCQYTPYTIVLDEDGQFWFVGYDGSYYVNTSLAVAVPKWKKFSQPQLEVGEKFVDAYIMVGGNNGAQFPRMFAMTNKNNVYAMGYNNYGTVKANGIDWGTANSSFVKSLQKINIQ